MERNEIYNCTKQDVPKVHTFLGEEQKQKMQELRNEEFAKELSELVLEILGVGYEAEVSTTKKNNGVLKDVLLIRRENSECIPCFYLEELYHSYCLGEPKEALAAYLADMVRGECAVVEQRAEQYLTKEWIKEHLFLRLVHFGKNKEQLADAVYKEMFDLAAVFYVLTEDGEDGIKSFRMPKRIWHTLELGSVEEYFPEILANTERLFPAEVKRMDESLKEYFRKNKERPFIRPLFPEEEEVLHSLYVVTNRQKLNGAMVLFYPGMLERLSALLSGDFYILPSSVHETLLLKKENECEADRLNQIICEVNEKQVLPEEVLSDHVYVYSLKKGALCAL